MAVPHFGLCLGVDAFHELAKRERPIPALGWFLPTASPQNITLAWKGGWK